MIILKNKGEMDIEVIKTMGINVKLNDSPIGFFGTGLKYAIAVFLREEMEIKLFIGQNEYEFFTESKQVRGKEFNFCWMRGPFDSAPLGFTTELGKNWEVWQAYREIHSNCLDESGEIFRDEGNHHENGYTTFYIEDMETDGIFLDSASKNKLFSDRRIEIFEGESDCIYYQGIRAKDLDKPSMYTYNIKEQCSLTEDRLICYDWQVQERINDSVACMENKDVIKSVITAKPDRFEYGLNMGFNNRVAPKETFMSVYAENAKEARPSVREYFVSHAPKEQLTPEQIATKFKQELDDFCGSHGITYDIDSNGFTTLMTQDLFSA